MSETMISRMEAIRICTELFPLVPWPNQWDGSEREQLIFGKGMCAGAKACAEALRQTRETNHHTGGPMHITEITVSAGRVVNHPYEQYSNLRPQVTLKASLTEADDATNATKALQSLAEQLIEDHKNAMLASIRQLHRMAEREQEMARLSHLITREQERLDLLRAEVESERAQLQLPEIAQARRAGARDAYDDAVDERDEDDEDEEDDA